MQSSGGVLKNFAKFLRKNLVESLFNNVAGLNHATLLRRNSSTGIFQWILPNF